MFFFGDRSAGVRKQDPSVFKKRRLNPGPSEFGSHDFSVAATVPDGLGRTKRDGSYAPS